MAKFSKKGMQRLFALACAGDVYLDVEACDACYAGGYCEG